MPTDFLLYWLTSPFGLLLIVGVIAVTFLCWRLLLGAAFPAIGFKPLAVAYVFALAGLLIGSFMSSYLDFSSRVALGWLAEPQRWFLVPRWTAYSAVLFFCTFVLPFIALIGVPLAAALIRRRRFGPLSVGIIALVLWLALAIGIWAGQPTHRVDPLLTLLGGLLPGILLVPVPFFLTLSFFARAR